MLAQEMKDIIKTKVNEAIRRQILAHNPHNNSLSREGISPDAFRDGTERPDEIGSDTWLEWPHVDGVMRDLVAERAHLRNRVGVLPPYSDTRMKELAVNVTEEIVWALEGLKTKKAPSGDTVLDEEPLPSIEGLSVKERIERDRLAKQRIDTAKTHREKAVKLLKDNNLYDNFFSLYLETMLEDGHLLGNPKKQNLPLDECDQLIVPFHYHNNHYTVAVCHFYKGQDTVIVNIKYYDSLGSDLSPELRMQFYTHFEEYIFETTGKHFVVDYKLKSRRDQVGEGHNCSIFASGKAIDLVNKNFGLPERLLGDLRQDNYKKTMDYYRRVFAERLKKSGQNVKANDNLKRDFDNAQREFEAFSPHSQEITVFNSFMLDVIWEFETTLTKVQKHFDTASAPLIPNKPLPNIDPIQFLDKLSWLYDRADQLLYEKRQLANPSQKDKDDIELLRVLFHSFSGVSADLEREALRLSNLLPHNARPQLPYVSFLTDYSWYTVLMIAGIGTVGLFVGIPGLLAGILNLGPMLPNNPTLLMFFGGLIFFVGAQAVPMINNYFNPETEEDIPVPPPVQTQAPQPTVANQNVNQMPLDPAFLNQFNAPRNVPPPGENVPPSVRRKLNFDI